MGKYIEQLGEQIGNAATGGLVGAGMGLLLEGHNDKRQLKQQRKLGEIQLEQNKNMADFNYDQQMRMWHDTNYGAQMGELKKAGLNPGLIYGMGGGGGATTNAAQGQGVNGGQAPGGGGEAMGLMMQRMQLGLMEAQRANIEADTRNKEVNTTKTGGVDTREAETRIASITQGIENQKAVEALTKVQSQIQEINLQWTEIQWKQQVEKIGNEITLLNQQNWINSQTLDTKIDIIKQELTNSFLQGEATKSGIQVNKEQIQKMAADISQGWKDLDIKDKQQKIQQLFLQTQVDFAPIDRVIRGIDGIVNGIGTVKGKPATQVHSNPKTTIHNYNAENSY